MDIVMGAQTPSTFLEERLAAPAVESAVSRWPSALSSSWVVSGAKSHLLQGVTLLGMVPIQ